VALPAQTTGNGACPGLAWKYEPWRWPCSHRQTPPREARVEGKTRETSVAVTLALDGSGRGEIHTGVPFLDHMLDSFARHGFFDLVVEASGDLHIDGVRSVDARGGAVYVEGWADSPLERHLFRIPLAGGAAAVTRRRGLELLTVVEAALGPTGCSRLSK